MGAGAAGLAAAIFAGEAARSSASGLRIVALEGARKPGAKILVSGGGRCNVTHDVVTPDDYCGGPRPLVRNVLRSFSARDAIEWMRSLGVELKVEPGGKMFPVTDSARTVLEALLGAASRAGVEVVTGARVVGLRKIEGGGGDGGAGAPDAFRIETRDGPDWLARRVIFATGGLALPKSGSDGAGLAMLARLGHEIVPTTPALAPLVLTPGDHPAGRFAELAGVSFEARLRLRAIPDADRGFGTAPGAALAETVGSIVFTHFGLSGPAAMDVSRHLARRRLERPAEPCDLFLGVPALATMEQADARLLELGRESSRRSVAVALAGFLPDRWARALAGDLAAKPLAALPREARRALAGRLADLRLHCAGDRGYTFAETTAGGVSLREVDAATMESRVAPGLHLCGEVLDADGRIGGFSFHWAWATGRLAGRAAVAGLARATGPTDE